MGLKPWREVAEPHADVASGRYAQAEFAADLAQVHAGKGEPEYRDPLEFFRRTYVTDGMARLLRTAAERMLGQGGEPVVQLKTAFGGGKTHTMLALYHLFTGAQSTNEMADVPYLCSLLDDLKAESLPKTEVAVLVGTALDPSKPRLPKALRGVTVRTLWGELGVQLGGRDGYRIVEAADQAGVSPGSDTLGTLFEHTGPCIILIDELLAYARNIYGKEGLPSGSFDSNLTFLQALTEAARAARSCMVVASIPESAIEIGGEGGRAALERIEHTFGRMEAIWTPVGALEGFEIVRRRLFKPIRDERAREQICEAFRDLYETRASDFPAEVRQPEYMERMRAAFPIHPEIFDRLYEEWGTLERFQKTRGVLRLMACAIHQLWKQGDSAPMILPGSIALDATRVRDELTQYLPDGWKSVVEGDVDGDRSEPCRIDQENPRFGQTMAARKVARTIFLGSAPSVKGQTVRGIEEVRVRLGAAQPGENVAVYNDALARLMQRLTHLYSGNSRYWYDLPANLRRTVEDRAGRIEEDEVHDEIVIRLKKLKDRGDFRGVHVELRNAEIPDEQEARLVVMPPRAPHTSKGLDSPAEAAARDILEKRGEIPRRWRNMLVFVAADAGSIENLDREVRQYMAWKSVIADTDTLNLDAHQQRQGKDSLGRADEIVTRKLGDAYSWLIVPTQHGANEQTWQVVRLAGGSDSVIAKAAKKAKGDEHLIAKWSPALLRMELDRWLWKDAQHLAVRKLWEYLCTYCYLPRLASLDVLKEAIREGLRSRDYFGYATSVSPAGRYEGLIFGADAPNIYVDEQSVLIKPDIALAQVEADALKEGVAVAHVTHAPPSSGGTAAAPGGPLTRKVDLPPPPATRAVRFFGSARLDATRFGRDIDRIGQEVIQHISSLVGADVELTLEIHARVPDGFPDSVVRIVSENCRTLKFSQHGFEEE